MEWSFKKNAPPARESLSQGRGLFKRTKEDTDIQDVEVTEHPKESTLSGEASTAFAPRAQLDAGVDGPAAPDISEHSPVTNRDSAFEEFSRPQEQSASPQSRDSSTIYESRNDETPPVAVNKKSWWKRASESATASPGEIISKKKQNAIEKKNKGKRKSDSGEELLARPIKVLIGFLPDSSEKDTYFYMVGIAQKNLDSENIGYAGLVKYLNGYAYEIHEGGAGRGFLESILTYFRSLPPFTPEEAYRGYISTATRTLRIERTMKGLYSVLLPESSQMPQSEWITPGKKLVPLVEKRTAFFVGTLVILICSMIAMMGAYVTRYTPHTPTLVNIVRVPLSELPHSKWPELISVDADDYVKELKYENNAWTIKTQKYPAGKRKGGQNKGPNRGVAQAAKPPGSPDDAGNQ